MGFGNHLYLWLDAARDRACGIDRMVLETPSMQPWLEHLPRIAQELTITRSDVRFFDRRDFPWKDDSGTRTEKSYDQRELDAFIDEYLLRPGGFVDPERPSVDAGTLVLNVRRGDFYSNPELRANWGFDVPSYVRLALERTAEDEAIERIHLVSDDLDWCRRRLPWVGEFAERVTYAGTTDGPRVNFEQIATARRIVMTNSTFSYWGGYVSGLVHGANHARIVAPRFFTREANDGRSWQLDERWTIIEDIEGGWDAPYDD